MLCITVGGAGFSPFASGTVGSLAACAAWLLLWVACTGLNASRGAFEAAVAVGVVTASVAAIAWGPWALRRFASDDPKPFVLDEFAGQWLACAAAPVALSYSSAEFWVWLAVQFFLFRFFDVSKLAPARQAERLPGGWGVLVDDLIAGAYANITGQLLWRLGLARETLRQILG